ncbi:MAG: hypothetical protein GXO07_01490 [Crenarchaeota archaeon]|nr:hypothetical protein [Thermoproteota archaeon]
MKVKVAALFCCSSSMDPRVKKALQSLERLFRARKRNNVVITFSYCVAGGNCSSECDVFLSLLPACHELGELKAFFNVP